MLTIPSETTIAYKKSFTELSSPLKVTGNVNRQYVAVTAEIGKLTETNREDGATIEYKLNTSDGDYPANGLVWTESELRNGYLNDANAKTESLFVNIGEGEWKTAKAGTYQGEITFTATMQQAVAD